MIGDILQPTHLIFILVVALLVLGPKRLPEVGRSLGRGLRDFRHALSGEDHDHDEVVAETGEAPFEPAAEPTAAAAPETATAAPETTTEPETTAIAAPEPTAATAPEPTAAPAPEPTPDPTSKPTTDPAPEPVSTSAEPLG